MSERKVHKTIKDLNKGLIQTIVTTDKYAEKCLRVITLETVLLLTIICPFIGDYMRIGLSFIYLFVFLISVQLL